ncbi:phage head morphogenesis protein [Pseudotabrizicola algicola]|uniref:Phage head morphogenesis domain-containing protein n=1 Tax=Pseudotabrizicola algicola TaxID=2709381 RepID=A0A6B3RQ41_9RHOB|nr:phage minor head protein [Pseudotabrizicola algicola]NEX47611.1 hypothetical protein [Pseudotabrizicola algicola]
MTGIELRPLPHRDAIEYFTSKGYAPQLQRFHHLDVFREEHARNWVVAKAMRDDVSQAIRDEMTRALAEGRTLAQFQAELAPRLQELGWWGKQSRVDPQTGETVNAQLGSMRRLRTIFDTNMRTAHAAGHWAAIQRTKRAFPYLHYIQVERPSKRHDHTRFHDKIWHVDDPVWLRIYPPNGWFCGCHVIQRTEGWMKRNNRKVDPVPDLEERPWVNKRSGEVFDVPRGVNPGFDTNPGAAWLDIKDAWTAVTPEFAPDKRARELGIIEGLRLQRLGRGTESLVATRPDGEPAWMASARPDRPAVVSFDRGAVPAGGSLLHSHITDTTLSSQDLTEMFDSGAASVVAITPGGSIWRAVRVPAALARDSLAEFTSRLAVFRSELTGNPDARFLYHHALALWLEKNGVITYRFHMSERVRQLLDRNAELVRRLIDGTP